MLLNSSQHYTFCIITLAIIGYIGCYNVNKSAKPISSVDVNVITSVDGIEATKTSDIACNIVRNAFNSGFHRIVETNAVLFNAMPISAEHCDLLLIESIPAGMYVDLYQTEAAYHLGGPKVYSFVDIDVEQPAYLSKQHVVYVYSSLGITGSKLTANVSVPVHLRYHLPAENSDYEQVTLPSPQVLVHCQPDTDWLASQSKVDAPCFRQTSVNCSWKSLACTSLQESGGHLVFDVPIGKLGHYTLVIIGTTLTTLVGTALLIGAMVYTTGPSYPTSSKKTT